MKLASQPENAFLNFVKKYRSEKNVAYVIITVISEYAWICLNKQSFEYVQILNMPDKVLSLSSEAYS